MLTMRQKNRRKRQEYGWQTINLRTSTKERIKKDRAPGQCYDGFICQLVDLWEKKGD